MFFTLDVVLCQRLNTDNHCSPNSEHQSLLGSLGLGGIVLTMLRLPVLVGIDYHRSSSSQQPCTSATWKSQKHEKFL